MKCGHCNQEIENDKQRCNWCGYQKKPSTFRPKSGASAERARNTKWWWIAAIASLVLISTIFGESDRKPNSSSSATPIEMMSAVFVGGHSTGLIKNKMRQLATQLGEPATQINYQKWGSILVALRKDLSGVTEMQILRCVLATGQSSSFPDLAAICATLLDTR